MLQVRDLDVIVTSLDVNLTIHGKSVECHNRGSSECMMHSDFLSFLTTVNHCDRYEELDGSYTPAIILHLIRSHTFL